MNLPRIMIAAASSGGGKTTVTCGILQALVNRGVKLASFKCGPDYIDPMFHSKVIGAKSRNLDPFFFSQEILTQLLCKNSIGSELAIIEGVMGFYDGMGGVTTRASSYELATLTQTPTVLILDCRGVSTSLSAVVKGFLEYQTPNPIAGVILNRVSPMLYPRLKEMLESQLPVEVLGYLPFMKEGTLESRHLGLVTADEITNLKEMTNLLANQVEETVNLNRLIHLADTAVELPFQGGEVQAVVGEKVRIAVARDKAFCFYYQDGLDLLEELGAEIAFFSPMEDASLPEGACGLLLGGGYPELYLEQLSANCSMLQSIRAALKQGMPCVAECGGFMYLQQEIGGRPMVGALNGRCTDGGRLKRFGYITLTAHQDNLLCQKGQQIPAHEFHYWESDCCGDDFTACRPLGNGQWDCVQATENLFAGYPHFHFCAVPDSAKRLISRCQEYRRISADVKQQTI